MQIDAGVNLKPYNTFGLPAVAKTLVRITSDADVRLVVDDRSSAGAEHPRRRQRTVSRDAPGRCRSSARHALVEERPTPGSSRLAPASWHDFVHARQRLARAREPGAHPGTVGAPVQNIELRRRAEGRFESLDAVDRHRSSVTLTGDLRLRLPRQRSSIARGEPDHACALLAAPWRPVLGYLGCRKR
jgi:UDP-N-acetylmuramate dehydrogenase